MTTKKQEFEATKHMFRYGQEKRYKNYKNFYVDNMKALNKKEIQAQKNNENTIFRYEVRYEADKRIERYIRPENTRRFLWPIEDCQGKSFFFRGTIIRCLIGPI